MHEKRASPRVQIDIDVACEIKDRAAVNGRAKDVSLGGMFIESEEALPFNTQVTIVAKLGGHDLRLTGVVRWSKPGGFGVQFGLLGARETHVIAQLMKH